MSRQGKLSSIWVAIPILLALFAPIAGSVTQSDCNQASTPLEKAICSDPSLKALDEKLTQSYNSALMRAGKYGPGIREEQRHWLADLGTHCGGNEMAVCLRQALTNRISELESEGKPPAPVSAEYKITSASKLYDFVIRIHGDRSNDLNDYSEGPGEVLVFHKGDLFAIQTIFMENIFASLDDKGRPLANATRLYEDQGVINVGDFNFDGHEDFAIQNGNEGAYGQPSYSVYLFEPTRGIFEFNEALSRLTNNTLGMFQIDSQGRHLVTFSKSGCCYRETVDYAVNNNVPVPVSRVTEDGSKDPKQVIVSHESYVNGRWQGTTERVPSDSIHK
jgi:uncharacterized protein